jgi:hypothetical protein
MKRILVLDAHTNQALAAVRTLGRHGYHVMVASHRPGPIAGWSRFARGGFRLRREDLHEYGRLLTWAHGQGVNAVLPMTERGAHRRRSSGLRSTRDGALNLRSVRDSACRQRWLPAPLRSANTSPGTSGSHAS